MSTSNNTTSTIVTEWEDDDGSEDGDWPYATRHIKCLIEGDLADRIRARFGVTDGESVYLTEVITSGGYSEYTQEDYCEFTVECGFFEREFGEIGYEGTSAGYLQAWLNQEETK